MPQTQIPMVALSRQRYHDKWILEGEHFFVHSESDADEMTGIRPPLARHLTPEERSKLAPVQNTATMQQKQPPAAVAATQHHRPTLGVRNKR